MSTAFKRGRSPNSPVTTLLQNPGLSNTTTSTNANSPGSVNPMNTNSPSSASSRRSVRIPKNLSKIQVQPPAPKRQRLAKALVGRKRGKLNNTAGETSGNSSNSAMNNRPTPKRKKITSATRSALRQIPQPAFRTAAMGAAVKERTIANNYANLVNQRNALPSGYKVKFVNKLLLNTAKNGDKAVKIIRARMRETVAEGLDRYKNLRSLTKKLSPNGQKKFTNNIKNNLSMGRHMMIKNAILKEVKKEANAKAVREKAANEKKRANTVINSAIKQRRANAKKAEEKAKQVREKAITNAKAVIRERQQKEANQKANANAKAVTKSVRVAKSANAATKSPNKPANSRRNSATKLPPARGAVVRNNANSKFSGKGKEGILKVIKNLARITQSTPNSKLVTLMPQIPVNSIKEYYAYAYAILYDMVDMIPDTQLNKVSVDSTFIQEIHKRIMQLNEYSSGRSTGSSGDRKEFTFELKDDDVVEFLFLMWLDGSHDEYFKNLSFKDFLNSDFCTNFFEPIHIQLAKKFVEQMPDATKIFNNNNNNNNARLNSIIKKYKDKKNGVTKFKQDKTNLFYGEFNNRFSTILKICIEAESVWFFIHEYNPKMFKDNKGKVISVSKKIINKDLKTLKDTFEKILKTNIGSFLGVNTSNIGITRTGLSSKMKGTQTRLVSLDYQSSFATIDAFINKTSQFRPYVTAGNMIYPGKHMLKSSVYKQDVAMLTRVLKNRNPEIMNNKSNAALEAHYHVGPLNFSLKNNGKDFFKVNLNIRKEGPSNNVNKLYSGDFFDLKINNKAIMLGATAKNAGGRGANNQSNASSQAMMGKFMGDALQYMVVAIQNKYRDKNRIFGSGDGSACFMYAFMCKKLDIPPRLLVDLGGSNKIMTYVGLNGNNKQLI